MADNRLPAVFFRPHACARPFNGRALAGRLSSLPVSIGAGSPTLPCARSPRLATGSEPQHTYGARIMQSQVFHSGHQAQPSEIIRAALRDAAIAPTIYDALDVTGDALRRVLELVSEGGHVKA